MGSQGSTDKDDMTQTGREGGRDMTDKVKDKVEDAATRTKQAAGQMGSADPEQTSESSRGRRQPDTR
jgi:hypothetical protein